MKIRGLLLAGALALLPFSMAACGGEYCDDISSNSADVLADDDEGCDD